MATKKPATKPATPTTDLSNLKVTTTTGNKVCKPFVLEVMVFAPDSGFKIEVNIERSCTPQADPIWKLVFDLYKKKKVGEGFDQIVHVSYTGKTPVEQKGLAATAVNGINDKQADVTVNRIGPAVTELENAKNMTPQELEAAKANIQDGSSAFAKFAL
jgi:hypothetical protein